MLKTLEKYDSETALGHLSSAIHLFLPRPFDDGPTGDERKEADLIVAEARQSLNLRDDDMSADAKSRILDIISAEIDNIVLKPGNEAAIRHRLGNRGAFPPDQYDVNLSGLMNASEWYHGLTPKEILDTARYPQAFEHLTPPPDFSGDELISIFCSYYFNPEIRDKNNYNVVIGRRDGTTIHVDYAWRVPLNKIDSTYMHITAIDMLTAFVEAYGAAIVDEGAKIIINRRTPRIVMPTGSNFELNMYTHNEPGWVDVGLAFAVDVTRLQADLEAIGFQWTDARMLAAA